MGDMSASDIALDSVGLDELNSPEAKALLDTIDSLRELQVGEIVNLPQIIVVGDQSSGKSSVLEAISRVRFPTKGDVCTRFATELVLRRSPETKIEVRIDWATGAGSGSSQQFHRTSFDKDALPEIINGATEKMGIRVGNSKGFSKDILHVEIAGPDIYPVTLVDLPGFFHSETADQTREDKQIVKELAESYMKQLKSIILVVVSANQNLANQMVVDEAKEYDPNRERTLGIITKPDLTAPGSQDERKCLQLIRGQESKHKLKLGWHVLRNRPEGQEKTTADDRDAEEEKFFQSGAWSSINPMSRGITPLRRKLSKVLLQHIQKTLPGLIEEIESNLSARQRAIEQLGKPRSEPDELRTYLLEIAERFQRLARDGIDGRYGDEFFGDLYNSQGTRKLRALLRSFNRAFHATLVSKGVDREIEWDDEERFSFDDGGFEWIRNGDDPPEHLEAFLDLFKNFPDPTEISETELCKELEDLAAANQGTEYPGLPNGNLGFQLFKMQAKPWGGIADFYLDQVVDFAKAFVEDLFIHIIGADKQTANAILVFCVGGFFEERRKLLKEKLQEILRPYVSTYGPPLDAEFHATLSSRITRREAERVASLLEQKFPAAFTDKPGKGLTYEAVEEAISSAGAAKASEFGTEKVIDMAMTHFQVQTAAGEMFDED
ncbi:putative dynamin family protein [Phaeoacremonium minimum UCRPA7]|uniref:Putative dynamin family protein n=1 Tax=Phaeoacremonium minimum (strain UCR-PA7) TaxID=1286976 RepID=R8BMN6_PHAM7|nr:putative dynamin family protein [Phaeoacremonium minimum UCRPA7]EOO00609.1 putative dynamin family protein [Phaeoacremonium minimum UCRPA7]